MKKKSLCIPVGYEGSMCLNTKASSRYCGFYLLTFHYFISRIINFQIKNKNQWSDKKSLLSLYSF